jgi:hypothetical protein
MSSPPASPYSTAPTSLLDYSTDKTNFPEDFPPPSITTNMASTSDLSNHSPTLGASMVVELAGHTRDLLADSFGTWYSFRAHPKYATLSKMFAKIDLVSVRAFVYQTTVPGLAEGAVTTRRVRFGLAPRETTLSTNDTNVVDFIPHLVDMVLLPNECASTTVTFGEGGIPFPPGMETDFRDVEGRFNFAEFLLCQPRPDARPEKTSSSASVKGKAPEAKAEAKSDAHPILCAQLTFIVRCSGENYGVIY